MNRFTKRLELDKWSVLDKPSIPAIDLALQAEIDRLCAELELSPAERDALLAAHLPLCRVIDDRRRSLNRPMVVGVNGAQGSGKTTFCRFAQLLLESAFGWRVCGLSIDDLYLCSEQRHRLAEQIHPLLAVRGVPGTHDFELGLSLLRRLSDEDLENSAEIAIPAFDKATDDHRPERHWPRLKAPVDIVIFEGWCVAAQPQSPDELTAPINPLEAQEDSQGIWRRYVNQQLHHGYAKLFAQIDFLIFLEVPSFDHVRRWRGLQEEKMARRRPGATGLMDAEALDRFMMLYERTTRHALATLPGTADIVCRLDESHRIVEIDVRATDSDR